MNLDVAGILLKSKAVVLSPNKPFLYSSGLKGPIYCDNRLLISYVKEREDITDCFVKMIMDTGCSFDLIAAIATAAIPWGAWIAQSFKIPLIYIRSARKDHGRAKEIEGEYQKISEAIIIEDTINQGTGSLHGVNVLRENKIKIKQIFAIVNYGFDHVFSRFCKQEVNINSLCSLQNIIEAGIKENIINQDDKKTIMHWYENPEKWTGSN